MKLKKVISVMLVGACVFSMAACGSKKEEAFDKTQMFKKGGRKKC